MRNDYKTASRLFSLIERVDRGMALRLKDIVEEFGVDERCAREYRDFVCSKRELVEYREGRSKAWRKESGNDPSIERAAALEFAVQALGELEGTAHLKELRNLAQQERLTLDEVDRMRLDRVTRNFQVRTAEQSRNPNRSKWASKLLGALAKRRICRIQYDGLNGGSGPHEIEPWGMLLHRGRLACMAGKRDPAESDSSMRRMYLIDGIQSVVVTQRRFQVPAARHTDYAELFKDSFGIFCGLPDEAQDIHLRVHSRHAIALKQRAVHPSQHVSEDEDGTLNVRLRLVICPEFIGFLLGLLPDVEVIAPQVLRAKLEDAVALWRTRAFKAR